MIVSNPPEPRVSRSLMLLENLRQTIAAIAAREEELTKDVTRRHYATERKYQNALKENAAALTRDRSEAETAWQARRARARARHEARHVWLGKAERTARRGMPKRIEATRGEWLGGLQRQKFRVEKEVAGELEAADAALAETRGKLAEQKARLDAVTARARRALRGSLAFRRMLSRPAAASAGEPSMEEVEKGMHRAGELLDAFRAQLLPRIFSLLPPYIIGPLVLVSGAVLVWGMDFNILKVGAICAGLLAVMFGIHFPAMKKVRLEATAIADVLTSARRMHAALGSAAESRNAELRRRAQERQVSELANIQERWKEVGAVESEFVEEVEQKLRAQVYRIAEKSEKLLDKTRAAMDAEHELLRETLEKRAAARTEQITAVYEQETKALAADESERWSALVADWRRQSAVIWQELEALITAAARLSRPWDAALVEGWKPPVEFAPVAAFARLEVDLAKHAGALPKDARLSLPCPVHLTLPLALTFPAEGSLLFETSEAAAIAVAASLNHIILRLLATTPPGRVAFTIIDPAGLGSGFAGLMHLSDYEDGIINRRIWTQRDQIEERLGELSAHIEKVIQMYLRNDYETITEFNAQAGSVAEKYHFIVVADFPSGFSEIAAKRLQSIAATGPRCGVFTLIHWDQRLPQPDGFVADNLRRDSVRICRGKSDFLICDGPQGEGLALTLDAPPEPALALELVHRIGKSSIDSGRVQVPFSQIAPQEAEMWTNDTTNELRIAVGRTGATKHQILAIGKGTRQHALFAGKTGSGKSTLFHVIITNLSLACSPDQVEFYLIDFKKGVEFKCYATQRLPHARVVAIESDREFALSVLQRVDEELKRRGDLFRKFGVQDVAGYKRAGGGAIPRTLLIIDEFQEFFVEDDTIAQTASLLFDRIVRQGRAFGIHVLLGSQTLGGAYSLARATLGQMVIRVALQCNEADAYLIMDDGNSAPRLLSRPGEGIYNDAAGALEGNSPFQVVWLPDDERDLWLAKVRTLAQQHGDTHAGPIVFEGNAPADASANELLSKVLRTTPLVPPPAGRCWLGAPNSIKGPTEAVFHRQSGNHLLIVGQREEAALSMLALSVRALAAQYPAGTAKFYFIHSAPPGTADAEFIAQLAQSVPHGFIEVRTPDLPATIDQLATEMKARSSGEIQADRAPAIYIFIHGLHRFKKLRQEDDFRFSAGDAPADTGAQFNDLICEGSALGLHLIVSVDTFNNVNRTMNRKALSEFEMRVVFQMSANDSSSLIDSPKASTLGLHRALFYNEHEGTLETFRPYAQPAAEWWK